MLEWDDNRFFTFFQFIWMNRARSYEFPGVSYETLKMMFNRIEKCSEIYTNSDMLICNFTYWVVVPFLANKEVCTSADSDLISDYIGHVGSGLVLQILMTCKKQIINKTAEMVIAKPDLVDSVLTRLFYMEFWSEDVTGFIASVVEKECSLTAVEHVMNYLIEFSDEKSFYSCALVITILGSHGKNDSIFHLCTIFAEQSKCFLKKALLQKLDSFL